MPCDPKFGRLVDKARQSWLHDEIQEHRFEDVLRIAFVGVGESVIASLQEIKTVEQRRELEKEIHSARAYLKSLLGPTPSRSSTATTSSGGSIVSSQHSLASSFTTTASQDTSHSCLATREHHSGVCDGLSSGQPQVHIPATQLFSIAESPRQDGEQHCSRPKKKARVGVTGSGEPSEKKYWCPLCLTGAGRPSDLKRHMIGPCRFTRGKPDANRTIECPFCVGLSPLGLTVGAFDDHAGKYHASPTHPPSRNQDVRLRNLIVLDDLLLVELVRALKERQPRADSWSMLQWPAFDVEFLLSVAEGGNNVCGWPTTTSGSPISGYRDVQVFASRLLFNATIGGQALPPLPPRFAEQPMRTQIVDPVVGQGSYALDTASLYQSSQSNRPVYHSTVEPQLPIQQFVPSQVPQRQPISYTDQPIEGSTWPTYPDIQRNNAYLPVRNTYTAIHNNSVINPTDSTAFQVYINGLSSNDSNAAYIPSNAYQTS
ncbi:hypothetical protein LTR56_023113 [Elasticomyces elasticus]|nr:hypothetical protein LTR56_023113 [Elasticomyces elasticus]KAK3668970.1 hypothetical protein LTR22_000048 [Elasticomyces elasticus]KAK4907228.1 hypothetical protein LTR49_023739 [Elasticomyces elasticus]